jgi:hypothetical protein
MTRVGFRVVRSYIGRYSIRHRRVKNFNPLVVESDSGEHLKTQVPDAG